MKSRRLFECISEIDDELIKEADEYDTVKKKKNMLPFIASAAVIVLLVLSGFVLRNTGIISPEPPYTNTTTAQTESSTKDISDGIKPQTLSLASYPDFPSYPKNPNTNDPEITAQYNIWRNEIHNISKIETDDESVQNFSKKIMSTLLSKEDKSNKIISPLNIYMALSLLAETADGSSREQLLSLLGTDSISSLQNEANNLWRKNYRDDGYMKSVMANSLWLNEDISFNENTIKALSDNYFASVFRGTMGSRSFDSLLNSWISEQTDGLISPDLTMPSDTVMGIASTLVYKTRWENEFRPEKTEEDTFYSPEGEEICEFMKKEKTMMRYFWGEGFSAVNMTLDIGGRMWFILPDKGVSAEDILSSDEVNNLIYLNESELYSCKSSELIRVNLSVPKFDIYSDTDIVNALKSLGVTDIFSPLTADFSPLTESEAFVNKINHGVRLKIDEEGISAAAYTMLLMPTSPAPPENIVDFKLNKPFAFVITLDGETPLFAGVVNHIS